MLKITEEYRLPRTALRNLSPGDIFKTETGLDHIYMVIPDSIDSAYNIVDLTDPGIGFIHPDNTVIPFNNSELFVRY